MQLIKLTRSQFSDEEHQAVILKGLPPDFDTLKTVLAVQPANDTADLEGKLREYHKRLSRSQKSSPSTSEPNTALYTRQRRRRKFQKSSKKLYCRNCPNVSNHSTKNCKKWCHNCKNKTHWTVECKSKKHVNFHEEIPHIMLTIGTANAK